jgi:hypothetical protein
VLYPFLVSTINFRRRLQVAHSLGQRCRGMLPTSRYLPLFPACKQLRWLVKAIKNKVILLSTLLLWNTAGIDMRQGFRRKCLAPRKSPLPSAFSHPQGTVDQFCLAISEQGLCGDVGTGKYCLDLGEKHVFSKLNVKAVERSTHQEWLSPQPYVRSRRHQQHKQELASPPSSWAKQGLCGPSPLLSPKRQPTLC